MEVAQQLVPKVIRIIWRTVVIIVVFFLILNAFMALSVYFNMSSLAKNIQNSVELHGYLPKEDFAAFQRIVNTYNAPSKEEINTDGSVLPGLNMVLSDLRIVVYDVEGNGKTSVSLDHIDSTTGVPTNSQFWHFIENNDTSLGGIHLDARRNKKQQGSCLYAGVAFKYRIIHPLSFAFYSNNVDNILDNASSDSGWWTDLTIASGANNKIGKLRSEGGTATEVNTDNLIPTSSSTGASLFIQPVITREWYPDLSQSNPFGS